MTRSYVTLCILALALLAGGTGCEQGDRLSLTAEVDDAGYKRGKELQRQGRNQEALAAFLKVIEKRGDDSAESHLEAGLLYASHFKDPIAAIYHFKKCRELKPNSPTGDLVRQQIDAATKEFARTLPGDPLSNAAANRFDAYDQIEKYQRENEALKAEVAALKMQNANRPPVLTGSVGGDVVSPVVPSRDQPPASGGVLPDNPFVVRSAEEAVAPRNGVTPTPAPGRASVGTAAPTRPSGAVVSTTGARRHVVGPSEGLMAISARYYNGNKSRWRDILKANPGVKDPNRIPLGTELIIPP